MLSKITKVVLAIGVVALTACTGTYWTQGNPTWAVLTGGDEVPPVRTSASGNGRFMIETDGAISGHIVVNGMDTTAAHIHMGGPIENGPVIITLNKGMGGEFTVPMGAKLTADQMVAFKAGRLYVNAHSAANKGGEVRGEMRW
jgi:hypothetical protein